MSKQIYFIQETGTGAIKIGFTNDIKTRQRGLSTSNPNQLKLLAAVAGTIADEMKIHDGFKHLRIKGEWYRPEPELLQFIEEVNRNAVVPFKVGCVVLDLDGEKISERKNWETLPTSEESECKKWIDIANNLPDAVPSNDYVSIDAAARLLGVSAQTLRNWEEQGRITPQYTKKGHRRYGRLQLLEIRKQQMNQKEMLLPGITPAFILQMVQQFLQGFDPLEKINLTICQDDTLGKVRITADSDDGLTLVSKSFNIKK